MWPHEHLTLKHRVNPSGLPDLSELIIFPKLYRRLVAYFKDTHNNDLAAFDTWLRAPDAHRDDRALLPSGEVGNLHDLYELTGAGLRLLHRPEELTFI